MLVIIKGRDGDYDFVWQDTVRGLNKTLSSNRNTDEKTDNDGVLSVNTDGFVVGANTAGFQSDELNKSGKNYVTYCFEAGGAPTADNTQTSGAMTANSVSVDGVLQSAYTPSGSPSTYPKRMSIGTKQGFSIVQFVGNATNRTLPHGLGKPAKFMIVKNMDTGSTGWGVYHDAIGDNGGNNYIELSSNGAAGADNTAFQNTAPTSDVFSLGTKAAVNNDTDNTIAYIWCDIPGLQKFGSYTGNNDADGPFVELGFRPAVLWVKRIGATGSWYALDIERDKFNNTFRTLSPNQYAQEDSTTGASRYCDFLSNGFKARIAEGSINASDTYIYAAWATAPAFNLFGGQSNAR